MITPTAPAGQNGAPRVLYYSPFASASGYGRAACDYAACMVKAGIDLKIQALEDDVDTDNLDARYQWLVPYATREDDFQPTHVIVHTIPQYCHEFVTSDLDPARIWGPGVKKIALTTWETNKLPAEAVASLNGSFDLVITPSTWNDTVFRNYGVTKTEVVYHSFDPDFWYDPPFWNKSMTPYVFYSIAEWNERKNVVGLLKAYYATFRADDNVRLVIACKAFHKESVDDLALATGFDQVPRVEWVGMHPNRLDEKGLVALHRRGHCYVSLARGEGWGLGAFEAALLGNHVIYSDYSGHQTFMRYTHKRSAIRCMQTPVVDAKLEKDVECAGLKIPKTADVPGFGFAADQFWAEPDLSQAMEAMRAAYEMRHGCDAGTFQDMETVRKMFTAKFSYEAVGATLRKLLEEL